MDCGFSSFVFSLLVYDARVAVLLFQLHLRDLVRHWYRRHLSFPSRFVVVEDRLHHREVVEERYFELQQQRLVLRLLVDLERSLLQVEVDLQRRLRRHAVLEDSQEKNLHWCFDLAAEEEACIVVVVVVVEAEEGEVAVQQRFVVVGGLILLELLCTSLKKKISKQVVDRASSCR